MKQKPIVILQNKNVRLVDLNWYIYPIYEVHKKRFFFSKWKQVNYPGSNNTYFISKESAIEFYKMVINKDKEIYP